MPLTDLIKEKQDETRAAMQRCCETGRDTDELRQQAQAFLIVRLIHLSLNATERARCMQWLTQY